jgi:hypothetical protein
MAIPLLALVCGRCCADRHRRRRPLLVNPRAQFVAPSTACGHGRGRHEVLDANPALVGPPRAPNKRSVVMVVMMVMMMMMVVMVMIVMMMVVVMMVVVVVSKFDVRVPSFRSGQTRSGSRGVYSRQ